MLKKFRQLDTVAFTAILCNNDKNKTTKAKPGSGFISRNSVNY